MTSTAVRSVSAKQLRNQVDPLQHQPTLRVTPSIRRWAELVWDGLSEEERASISVGLRAFAREDV